MPTMPQCVQTGRIVKLNRSAQRQGHAFRDDFSMASFWIDPKEPIGTFFWGGITVNAIIIPIGTIWLEGEPVDNLRRSSTEVSKADVALYSIHAMVGLWINGCRFATMSKRPPLMM